MGKIILCDLDGTVWEDNEAIKKASLEILGKELDKKEVRRLPKEIKGKIYDLAFTKYKDLLRPKENVIRFLKEKKKEGFLIFILTARLKNIEKDTVESLNKFEIPFDKLIIREDTKTKDEIWKMNVLRGFLGKFREIIFIDDKKENIEIIKKNFGGVRVILAKNVRV